MHGRPAHLALDTFGQIDLSEPHSIDAAVADLPNRIDGLINVAGVSSSAPWQLQFQVNFLGTRHLVQRCTDRLAPNASAVNVASGTAARWREHIDELQLSPIGS